MKSNLKHLLSRAMLMLVAVAGGGIFSSCDKSIADNPAVPTTVTVNTFMADGTTPLPVTTFKLVSIGTNNTYDLSAAIPEGGVSTFSTEFLVNDYSNDLYFDAFATDANGKSYTANIYYHPVRGQAQTINVKLKETATPADDSDDSDDALNVIDLSTVTEDITIEDGLTVTGELSAKVKISIADGATVTLDGITINGTTGKSLNWAGITCVGDATIILKDGTTNTVKGFNSEYSGIFVPKDKTLTIKGETEGTGKLIASSNGDGAGIGGGDGISSTAKNCGNIVIQGGVITATGGSKSAGIGSGGYGSCGDITISGGTVTATGGEMSAAIGSGYGSASCGKITITDGVTSVTATKGSYSPNSIGAGDYCSTCGTVTIGGKVVDPITQSPYIYPAPTIGDVTIDPFAAGGDPIAPKQ